MKKEAYAENKSPGQLALEDEAAGRYGEALNYYNGVLRNKPKDLSALLGKARCLQSQNQEEEAIKYFMQAAKVASDKGDNNGQYQALSGIIEMKPNNYTIYDARGDLLYTMKDYSGAARDFSKVVSLDRFNLKAYYKLGDSYYNNKEYARALDAFKGAEELNFGDPKSYACLAKAYCALDDKKNTKKSYEKFKEVASYSTSLEYTEDPGWKKVLEYLGYEN